MKRSLVVLCLLIVTSAINAQTLSGYGLKLGLGITNSKWGVKSSDTESDQGYISGFSARAFADFLNYPFFNVEGELGFSQKGMKESIMTITVEDPDGSHRTLINRLNYVSASVMGKLKYTKGIFTPYLLAGPQFNYLASYDVDALVKPIYDRFEKSLWGYTVGMGSAFKLEGYNLLIEYRFEKDFTNNFEYYELYVKNYSHTFLIGVEL
ncbi:MAG TPA: porin family protein [Ignavibacteriales bacterium]|nr:porin family protein [Ignavibacteriales bacterium]